MMLAGSPLAFITTTSPVMAYSTVSYFSDSQLENGKVVDIKFSNNKLTYYYTLNGTCYRFIVDITPSDLELLNVSEPSDLSVSLEGPNSQYNGTFKTKLSKSDLLFGEDDLDIALESADMENLNDLIKAALTHKQTNYISRSSGTGSNTSSQQSSASNKNGIASDSSQDIENSEQTEDRSELYTDSNETKDCYQLKAVEKGTKRVIKKAKFKHTLPDGSSETLTSDTDGIVSVYGMPPGIHTFEEISVPDGYQLNETVYRVKVDESGKVEKIDDTTQRINARYENVDGSFGSYSIALDDAYHYGDTVSWKRDADSIFEEASVQYKVDGSKTTNVDIKRKRNTIQIGDRLDGKDSTKPTFKWSGTINGEKVSGIGAFSKELCVGSVVDLTIVPLNGYSLANTPLHIQGTVKEKGNIDDTITQNVSTTSNIYTISFNSNGGSTVANKSVKYNTAIGQLPTPVRNGYSFLGWFTDKTNGYQISESQIVDSRDETYYAHWQIHKHVIHFDTNGGNKIDDASKNYGESLLAGISEPTKLGYHFNGWFTAKNGGTKITEKDVLGDSDTTLYAHWTAKKYTVHFDGNVKGETDKYDGKPITVTYSEKYGVLPKPADRRGYVFDGWFTQKEGGEKVSESDIMGASDITYYAHWTPITYTANFDMNGADPKKGIVFSVEENEDIPIPNVERKGYIFKGWTGGNGTTPQKNVVIKKGTADNIAFKANWEPIKYKAKFDMNGSESKDDITFTCKDETSIANPSRKGYTFLGWTGSNGSSAQKDLVIPKGTYNDVSYKANWKQNGKNFEDFHNSHKSRRYSRGNNDPNGNPYGAQCVAGLNEYIYWGNRHATVDNDAWNIGRN